MADAPRPSSASASTSPSSSRVKKRLRQKTNQQKRALAHDSLIAFHENPSFGNAFRAWLAHIEETLPPQEYRSAFKFTRALRSFSSRGSGEPDYPETSRISADTLAQWVDDLAWSLNGECINSLEEDLDRTARVNRIMEEYAWYIQEAYFDTGRTVDETYHGEYEVERINGQRILVLRRYDPDGTFARCTTEISADIVHALSQEADTDSTTLRSYTTYFPAPLVDHVRRGDTLTLQICHLEQSKIWVPYMYSGFTPSREDGGTATPTERQARATAGRPGADPTAVLQSSLMRLDLSGRQRSVDRVGRHPRSRTPQRAGTASAHVAPPQVPGFDFNFDESKFTEPYFHAWDGDIDTDEDFADIVRPPDEEQHSPGSGSDSGINLYNTLRGRHS
ncbi:hypothetical protein EW145_g4242 [Phellinidium pouzarii]|uniref:Uncharacterized protein n=1 Tax=Phellinidium pouzarii TaxID=167371 RepID=A0A4S4L4H1_9AGAM|nr:hypothetical protein EW145_g4242 [Phellinidium pouzarii]